MLYSFGLAILFWLSQSGVKLFSKSEKNPKQGKEKKINVNKNRCSVRTLVCTGLVRPVTDMLRRENGQNTLGKRTKHVGKADKTCRIWLSGDKSSPLLPEALAIGLWSV